MDSISMYLLLASVWLAPTAGRKFQIWMGAIYVCLAIFMMVKSHA